jgi:uncharacterized protein
MATADVGLIEKANALLKLLRSNGIDVHEAWLFGSVVEDRQDEASDIDVAVVSRDFLGMPFYDVKKVSKFRRAIDLRIEIHPFALADVQQEPSPFYLHIKEKGVQLE